MDIFDIAHGFLKSKQKTYSFMEITGSIQHSSVGAYTLTGKGTGSISISSTGDKTSHETAVDGATFIMQIPGDAGQISITMQQTSDLHKWLLRWYSYLKLDTTDRSEWARTTAVIRSLSDDMTYKAVGISPLNLPTIDYQAQGKNVVWVLMVGSLKVT